MFLQQAYDWFAKKQGKEDYEEKEDTKKEYETIKVPIGTEHFPPCVRKMLAGIPDGRKRSVFILINFLKKCGWPWRMVEDAVWDWNKKNPEPLPKSYVQSQLNWHKNREYTIPNCKKGTYYKDTGVCFPDELCKKIKNPITYAIRKRGKNKKNSFGKK